MIWLIVSHIKSANTAAVRAQLEKEYQEKHKQLENEYAEKESTLKSKATEKEAALKKREQTVAGHEYELKSVSARAQYASNTLREVENWKRDLARRELELEQREQLLHRDFEAIIDYRVESQLAEYIRNKEKGLKERERIVNRQSRCYTYRLSKCDEREKEMYQRAVLIAKSLGVPVENVFSRKEQKLVDQLANELTKEHYALIDLVMSCPDDRTKDLLEWMQRFSQNLRR